MNHTLSLMAEPKREKLAPLININRELAAGLMGAQNRPAQLTLFLRGVGRRI